MKHSHGVFTLPLQTLNIKNIWWNWLIGHFPAHLPVGVTALPLPTPTPCPPQLIVDRCLAKACTRFQKNFMIFLRISRIFRTLSCSPAFLGLVLSPPRVVGCRQVPPQSGTRPQTYDSVTPKPSSQWQRDLVSSNYKGVFQMNTFQKCINVRKKILTSISFLTLFFLQTCIKPGKN